MGGSGIDLDEIAETRAVRQLDCKPPVNTAMIFPSRSRSDTISVCNIEDKMNLSLRTSGRTVCAKVQCLALFSLTRYNNLA